MRCPLIGTEMYWKCEECPIDKRRDKFRCEILDRPSKEARDKLRENADAFSSGKIDHETYVRQSQEYRLRRI